MDALPDSWRADAQRAVGKVSGSPRWKALSPAQPHSWVGKVGRGEWGRGRGGTAAGLGSPVPGWQATHILTLRAGNICSDPNITFWDTPSTYVFNFVSFRLKVLRRLVLKEINFFGSLQRKVTV